MKIEKSSLTVDGNTVHMSMPFAKVDENKRLVSGFATLDNIDSQGDVVLAEASAKAFARARGNIREMHQPLAVGKMVDFREDEYYDSDEKKFYRGIFVTARVSEGAEDTWKKVLDGTLTGFSIGGEVNDFSNEFVKDAGRTVRFIKDYDLIELSLVDNPANQLANVFSIQKSATGSVTVKGMIADTVIENVFICKDDETVVVKDTESEDCPLCGNKMENAGWFEAGENRAEKVGSIVSKFLNPTDKEADAAPESNDEGGVVAMGPKKNVNKNAEEEVTEETEPVVNEEVEETEEVETDEVTESDEEESESPEEVVDEETEIAKKIDELHEAVKKSLEDSKEETAEKVASLEKKIEETANAFMAKASEIEGKINEFGTKIEAQKSRLAELESSLEKMNSADALKKSANLAEGQGAVKKTNDASWNGAFSGKSNFSVDDLV